MTCGIAEMLAKQVRVMTLRQIVELYSDSDDPIEAAKRVAKMLRREGLITAWKATIAHLDVSEPLATWAPGGAEPSFPSISWTNERRWRKAKPVATTCLAISDKGRAHFGGVCRTPRPRELEHDVAVTSVYLQLKRTKTEVAATWRHEDNLPQDQSPRPDATIHRDGQAILLDVIGRGYSREKIRSLWRELRSFRLELR